VHVLLLSLQLLHLLLMCLRLKLDGCGDALSGAGACDALQAPPLCNQTCSWCCCAVQRTTELFTAPHAEVAPFSRVWNPDTNSVYEDPNDWPTESDDDDTITKDELYVSRCSPPQTRESVVICDWSIAFAASTGSLTF